MTEMNHINRLIAGLTILSKYGDSVRHVADLLIAGPWPHEMNLVTESDSQKLMELGWRINADWGNECWVIGI